MSTEQERVKAIATVIRDEFAMMQDPDEKHWEQWTREANRIIAADPLTIEHSKLKSDVSGVLDRVHVTLLALCAGKPVKDADEVICAVIRLKNDERLRGAAVAPKHDCNDGGGDHCWKCR